MEIYSFHIWNLIKIKDTGFNFLYLLFLHQGLNFGQMAVNEDGSFYVGNSSNEPVSFSSEGEGVLHVNMEALQLRMLLNDCIQEGQIPPLPENVCVDILTTSDSKCTILSGNWCSLYGVF